MIKISEIVLYIMLVLPISTLFVNQNITNKVIFGISIIVFFFMTMKRLKKKELLPLAVLTIEFFASMYVTESLSLYNFNDIFYLPLWFFMLLYFKKYIDNFGTTVLRHLDIVKLSVYIWEVLFLILRFANPSMNEEFSHRTASSAFLIIVMVWYIAKVTNNKKFNINLIIPLAAIFLLEVRTYLILALLVANMSYYSLFRRKRYYYFTIVPMITLTVLFVLQTSIGSRFVNITESYYGGVLATITSSRSVFWEADIRAFKESNFFNKFFGQGYNYIYDINYKAVNTHIWGHNDIIHILVTNGFAGIYVYLYAFKTFLNSVKRKKCDMRLFYFAIVTFVFCALLDGLYHYVCASYAIPFLFDGVINNINRKGRIENE